MIEPPICTEVTRYGNIGPTAGDETPSKVCGRPATKRISAPDVRPKYRCDEHARGFEALSDQVPGLLIERLP